MFVQFFDYMILRPGDLLIMSVADDRTFSTSRDYKSRVIVRISNSIAGCVNLAPTLNTLGICGGIIGTWNVLDWERGRLWAPIIPDTNAGELESLAAKIVRRDQIIKPKLIVPRNENKL